MGIDILVIIIVSALGIGFGVDTTVDYMKHKRTLESDRYESCTKYAESVKECRNLE